MERIAYEDEIDKLITQYNPDFIVLAKYMRILSPLFVEKYEKKILNIHHSFLPAFIGANPYRKAYERGVKLIGATAHFVTNDLDEGPIISQRVIPVDHTYGVEDIKHVGKEIEKITLYDALKLVLEDRVFVSGNKTVIL